MKNLMVFLFFAALVMATGCAGNLRLVTNIPHRASKVSVINNTSFNLMVFIDGSMVGWKGKEPYFLYPGHPPFRVSRRVFRPQGSEMAIAIMAYSGDTYDSYVGAVAKKYFLSAYYSRSDTWIITNPQLIIASPPAVPLISSQRRE